MQPDQGDVVPIVSRGRALSRLDLKRAKVFNARHDTAPIHLDNDQVEAYLFGVFGIRQAIVHRALPHPFELCACHRLGSEAGSAPTRPHFDKHQVGTVAGKDVDFAGRDPDVSIENGVSAGFEPPGSYPLPEVANAPARTYHGKESWATGA